MANEGPSTGLTKTFPGADLERCSRENLEDCKDTDERPGKMVASSQLSQLGIPLVHISKSQLIQPGTKEKWEPLYADIRHYNALPRKDIEQQISYIMTNLEELGNRLDNLERTVNKKYPLHMDQEEKLTLKRKDNAGAANPHEEGTPPVKKRSRRLESSASTVSGTVVSKD